MEKIFFAFLDIINHCEDRSFVNASWVVVGSEDVETNALKRTRDPLARIDVGLVKACQDALDLQVVFAVFQQFDEVLARKSRRELLRWHKESQRLLISHMVTPSITHVFHQPS